jgi:hypothetical protein
MYWWQLFRDKDRSRQCLIRQTGPDSVWSDRPVQTVSDRTDRSRQCLIGRPLVEPVCKGNTVYERLSTCVGTTYGHHINCAVRAVQHREQSVWYSKQVWLCEQHNTAYRGERSERELGLTDCTECVDSEFFYGKRGLLKQRTNRERLSLLFIVALFVFFVSNNNTGSVRITYHFGAFL